MLTHISNHQDLAVARLPEQDKGGVSIPALVRALTAGAQRIEDAAWTILDQRTVDGASGVPLQDLGRIVGQDPSGLTDARLRTWIRVRQKLNRCSGTIPEIQELCSLLVAGGIRVQVEELFPAEIVVRLGGGAEAINPTDAGNIVLLAKSGGVRAETISPVTTDATAFTLDDAANPGSAGGLGLGDTDNPTTGGGLATVI